MRPATAVNIPVLERSLESLISLWMEQYEGILIFPRTAIATDSNAAIINKRLAAIDALLESSSPPEH